MYCVQISQDLKSSQDNVSTGKSWTIIYRVNLRGKFFKSVETGIVWFVPLDNVKLDLMMPWLTTRNEKELGNICKN